MRGEYVALRSLLSVTRRQRQRLDAHALHPRGDVASIHLDVFSFELIAQYARAHERMFRVQLVNPAYERQNGHADWSGQVVNRAAAHALKLGLGA